MQTIPKVKHNVVKRFSLDTMIQCMIALHKKGKDHPAFFNSSLGENIQDQVFDTGDKSEEEVIQDYISERVLRSGIDWDYVNRIDPKYTFNLNEFRMDFTYTLAPSDRATSHFMRAWYDYALYLERYENEENYPWERLPGYADHMIGSMVWGIKSVVEMLELCAMEHWNTKPENTLLFTWLDKPAK